MGKNYYMLGDFKKASEVYERAVAADPKNAEYEALAGQGLWTTRRDLQSVYRTGACYEGATAFREGRRAESQGQGSN